jgi:D-alanyl-D-alanine carboxypeptidase
VTSQRSKALQRLLDAIPAAGSPGAYAEVREGAAVWKGTSGYSNVTKKRKLTTTALEHRVGSVTKTFIAATVLRLVDQRILTLDGDVGRYLPGVLPDNLADKITVRMLLNHTSGLNEYIETLAKASMVKTLRTTTYTPQQIVDATLTMPLVGKPGEKSFYSNTNYHLLGMLIAKVTGRSYAHAATELVFRPLHLAHTYFPGSDPAIRGPHATGYFKYPDGTLEDVTLSNHSYSGAAGALISTPQDVNTFFRALLTGRLLSQATMKEIRTVVSQEGESYGLGIAAMETPCGKVWGHSGFAFGYLTYSLHSENGSLNVALGTNRSSLFQWDPAPDDEAFMGSLKGFLDTALCPKESS